MKFLIIFVVFFILLLMNYLSYRLYLRYLMRKYALYFSIFSFIIQASFFIFMRTRQDNLLYILWGSSFCFGYFLFFFAILRFFLYKSFKPAFSLQSRRRFLKLSIDMYLLIIVFLFSLRGFANAASLPKIVKTDIEVPGLKSELKIAILSDIHLGRALGRDFLQALIKLCNEQNPDIVVITGDLLDDARLSYLEDLNQLRCKNGLYFVYGNHEYYAGFDAVSKRLSKIKSLNILLNQSMDVIGRDDVSISGVSDLKASFFGELGPDLKSLKPKANKLNILLSHQPKLAKLYDLNDFDLILCGHTHGGQVFPLQAIVLLDQGFLKGLYELGKAKMYVSTGAGYWGPTLRFLAPSELSILNLKEKK